MDNVAELKLLASKEPVSAFLGMELLELEAGHARVGMTVTEHHINFLNTVFGGIVMALADQAFGYAANSLRRPSVASQFNIHLLTAPAVGDRLFAEGRVLKGGRRVGVSEVVVTNQDGKLIARATATTIPVD